MNKFKKRKNPLEIPHNFLSPVFLDYEAFASEVGEKDADLVLASIYYHHDREDIEGNEKEGVQYRKNMILNQLPCLFKDFKYDDLIYRAEHLNRKNLRKAKTFLKNMSNKKSFRLESFRRYVLIKGLLNRIDYVASADLTNYEIEKSSIDSEGLSLPERIEKVFVDRNPANTFESMLRPAQKWMRDHQNSNIVLTASTGSGKTEAALLWIGQEKGFFTLPLKVAINAIYRRIKGDEEGQYGYKPVEVLHSGIGEIYLREIKDGNEMDIPMRMNAARLMSSPLTVCTVDQLFYFSFKHNGFEPILAVLAYSKVVIDEIQMYDPAMVAFLLYGLKLIHRMGGKFAIMTATVPNYLLGLLERELADANVIRKTFLDVNPEKHQLCYRKDEMDYEEILEKGQGHKVLVIANTVKKAQLHFESLNLLGGNKGVPVKLLHSSFLKKDRRMLEDSILKFGNPKHAEAGIWVTTQVVEASVDVDFDILYTEMCSVDSIIQRMGRILRHRSREEGCIFPNVVIHDTRNGRGKNNVIHPIIYDASVHSITTFIRENPDSWVSEKDKGDLMDRVYSEKFNKEIVYFEDEIRSILESLENAVLYNVNTSEAKRSLRNIVSDTVLPLEVFDELSRSGMIQQWENTFKKDKVPYHEKIKTISEIQDFTVNLSGKTYDASYSSGYSFLDQLGISIVDYTYEFSIEAMMGVGLRKKDKVDGSNFIE